jgi:hypothetical protein
MIEFKRELPDSYPAVDANATISSDYRIPNRLRNWVSASRLFHPSRGFGFAREALSAVHHPRPKTVRTAALHTESSERKRPHPLAIAHQDTLRIVEHSTASSAVLGGRVLAASRSSFIPV